MRKAFIVLLCLCMVLIMLPTSVMADETTAPDWIKICNIKLTDGDYLASNDATTASNDYTEDTPYVALYKDGVLKFNGLNIVNNEGGVSSGEEDHAIYWSYSSSGKHNLIIELVEGTVNNIVDEKWSAINGAAGFSKGPSLTIQGKGTLNVTGGSYGIWVWQDILIQKGATVNVTGRRNSGISNNTSIGSITISQGTDVTITGATYGVSSDNSAVGNFVVQGGNFTVVGNEAAVNKISSDFSGNTVYVSYNVTGDDSIEWDGTTSLTEYKYLSFSGFTNKVTTYDITKAETQNGSFDVDFEKSMADETITVTAVPDSGYELESVAVTDADSGSVAVYGRMNTRTFTMPAKNVTVSAEFTEITYNDYMVGSDNLEHVQTVLADIADVTKDANGIVFIKLTSDVNGRIVFSNNWESESMLGTFVIDLGGKTIYPGDRNEALCLDNDFEGTVTITGEGTIKQGLYNVTYTGDYATLQFAVAEDMDYFSLKNGNENIFDEKNTETKTFYDQVTWDYEEFVLTQGVFNYDFDAVWTYDTDSGYVVTESGKNGIARFLFDVTFSGDVTGMSINSGIKFINAENITEDICNATLIDAGLEGNVSTFYGDITAITEDKVETTYYAVAYIIVGDKIFWSRPLGCSPDFNKLVEYNR